MKGKPQERTSKRVKEQRSRGDFLEKGRFKLTPRREVVGRKKEGDQCALLKTSNTALFWTPLSH